MYVARKVVSLGYCETFPFYNILSFMSPCEDPTCPLGRAASHSQFPQFLVYFFHDIYHYFH